MQKKKIVFATIEAGGGHKMPAIAVYESLNKLFPGKYGIRIMDFMKDLGCLKIDTMHKETWKYMLSRPVLTKGIQTMASITGPVFREGFKSFISPFYDYLHDFLRKEKPDLIFSTHYFNTMAVSHVRARNQIRVVLINYLTEIFDINTYWYLKDVDHYIVASEEAENKLLKMNFPREKLHVFPYPIRTSFFEISRLKEEITASMGFDSSQKTLLITLGGEGIGSLDRILMALLKRDFPLNVIVVAGKNEDLKLEIEQNYTDKAQNTHIHALGFVNNINELISISDFCFIKPGPATTWEVLSFKKPIIFYRSAQLSEVGNIKFVRKNNIGYFVGNHPKKFIQILDTLINGSALEECRANYSKINIENGSNLIAFFLDAVLEQA